MELEKIKEIWKSNKVPVQTIRVDQMNNILSKKSFTLISRMKRNLLWELVGVIILYSAAGIYFVISGFETISLWLGSLFICFLFYFFMKNRLLVKMTCISCEIKINLERHLQHLQQYQKFYAWASTLLTPVSFLAGWFILLDVHGVRFPLSETDAGLFILFLGLGILVSVSTFFLNRIYVKKLYGRYVEKLKSLLNEMDEVKGRD